MRTRPIQAQIASKDSSETSTPATVFSLSGGESQPSSFPNAAAATTAAPQFDVDAFFDSLSDQQVMGMMQYAPLPAAAYANNDEWLEGEEVDDADMVLFEEYMSQGSLPQVMAAQPQSMMINQPLAVAGAQVPLASLPVNMQTQQPVVNKVVRNPPQNPPQNKYSTIDTSAFNLDLNAENEAPPSSHAMQSNVRADDAAMTSQHSPYSDSSSHVPYDSPEVPPQVASNVVVDSVAMDTNAAASLPFELPQTVVDANLPSTSATSPGPQRRANSNSSSSKTRRTSSTSSSRTKRPNTRLRDAPVSRDVSPAAVTPVDVITTIVGDKVEENELYRDVVTKPIKHQVEINVEGAHNRSVKNAINARVNRQKHKQFVQSLEEENSQLKDRITSLERDRRKWEEEKSVLKQEITYLKNVVANDSTIARVLQGLGNVQQVRLSSGFAKQHQQQRKRHSGEDAMDAISEKRAAQSGDVSAGVCLHVHNNDVSVEFCDRCANMSAIGKE